jgi:MoaA/NifB/PqqE/SkfB family radical SAM enzyme
LEQRIEYSKQEVTSLPEVKTVYLHLTKRCNLNCVYCYFDAGEPMESELSLSELAPLFNDIVLLKSQKLVFTGGEPLLRSDIFDIAQLFRRIDTGKQTRLCLMSNGVLIDEPTALNIAQCFDEVRISVDGPEKVNDKLRGKGSFPKAMKAIHTLNSIGIYPGVSITVMRPNAGYLPAFLSFLYREKSVTEFHISPFRPFGRGNERAELVYPWRETQTLVAQFWQKHFGIPSQLKDTDRHTLKSCGNCGVGNYMNIHPDGAVYPCHVLSVHDFLLGNIRRISLVDIYRDSTSLRKLRELDFTKLAGASHHVKLLLENATCLGEVYRDAEEELSTLLQA